MNMPMTAAIASSDETLERHIQAACQRMAPIWPLTQFVAVNPFQGLSDWKFHDAADLLARVAGARLYMPRDYYRNRIESGEIGDQDLSYGIERCHSSLTVDQIRRAMLEPAPRPDPGMPLVTTVLDRLEDAVWTDFVIERISRFCAAYTDLGQATFPLPWRHLPLYPAWRAFGAGDRTPDAAGLGSFHAEVARLPQDPRRTIAWALEVLQIPAPEAERYLHAALLNIGGWAAWMRYLEWQAELDDRQDDSVLQLLAIRVAWDALIYRARESANSRRAWREAVAAAMREPTVEWRRSVEIDRVLLAAAEFAWQRQLIGALRFDDQPDHQAAVRSPLQAAFCIDVRSEIIRRALETALPGTQTLGFAGFFGVPVEYIPLGAKQGFPHVPVLFKPAYRVAECCPHQPERARAVANRRRTRIALSKIWKGFKFSASSCFSFVESSGALYLPKLVGDSLGLSRPVPDPRRLGVAEQDSLCLTPTLDGDCTGSMAAGIPPTERADLAERILRGMGLTRNFARLVLLVGHGASTVNNPHAAGLECGACGGQSGEASARIAAALLNQQAVRDALRERGIEIPDDTRFVAALHDTTTDRVRLFDTDTLEATHAGDLERIKQALDHAGELTRMQRAGRLDLDGLAPERLAGEMERRGRDWSQVRPEWALANNAGFIAAPRERTAGVDLQGRVFLHDYRWQDDTDFQVLELIMTAPMVVAHWINMQYYASTVDNLRFGSGNKVLHNVVGGALGVLEGNGGDLRIGLSLQSLHDGRRWMHEPLRLSVFLEAPEAAIDQIIARHEMVRELVENGWLHLFRMDAGGTVRRRRSTGEWVCLDVEASPSRQ